MRSSRENNNALEWARDWLALTPTLLVMQLLPDTQTLFQTKIPFWLWVCAWGGGEISAAKGEEWSSTPIVGRNSNQISVVCGLTLYLSLKNVMYVAAEIPAFSITFLEVVSIVSVEYITPF